MTSLVGQAYTRILSVTRADSSTAAVLQTLSIRVALLFLNFFTGIIIARSLGAFGRGEQAAIALWPLLFATLATLGLPTALRYHTRQMPGDGSTYYAAAFLMLLMMGTVAGTVGALTLPLLLRGYDHHVIQMAQAFMLFAPIELVGLLVTARLEAIGDFRRAIFTQLNQTIVILLVLISLRVTGHISPATAALAYAVPCAAQTIWLAVQLWPRRLGMLSVIAQKGHVLLSYGLRSYGTDIVGALASQLDLAVIIFFLNAVDLGLYTIALALSRLIKIVHVSLITVIFPRASSMLSEGRHTLIARAGRLSTMASVAMGAVFLLVIPFVLPRLYGESFRAAIPLMPLLTAEAIVGGLGSILNQSFLSSGRPFVVTMIELGSIACTLVLLCILVPRMNILGAATALLSGSLIRLFAIFLAYRLVLDRPLPNMLPSAADFSYLRMKIVTVVNH